MKNENFHTISYHLSQKSRQSPHEFAIICKKKNISWSELANFSERIGHYLHKCGLKKGDRVGMWMDNGSANLLFSLGILRAGGIEVAMASGMGNDFVCKAFAQAQISFLICRRLSSNVREKLQTNLVSLKNVIFERELSNIVSANAKSPLPLSSPEDLALIQYTSGSSGEPKGVVLTQENFICACQARKEMLHFGENAKIFDILSLAHSCGKSLAFDAILSGSTLLLAKGFVPPAFFFKILLESPPTIITGPPLLFHFLLKLCHDKRLQLSLRGSLRYLEIGMAPVSARLIGDLRQAFPWTTIINRYGLTENAGAASLLCHPPGTKNPLESLGKGTAATSLELVNIDESSESFAAVGEIRIKGKNIMTGYWGDMLEGQDIDYRRRGFLTGDIAGKDENGFFYFLGRKDDMLKVCGEKVAPMQIENAISTIPEIEEVAVFGIESDAGDMQITAVYYAPENVSEKEIINSCATLPSYMMPRNLVNSPIPLPKTFSGKIAKKVLQVQQREKFGKSR